MTTQPDGYEHDPLAERLRSHFGQAQTAVASDPRPQWHLRAGFGLVVLTAAVLAGFGLTLGSPEPESFALDQTSDAASLPQAGTEGAADGAADGSGAVGDSDDGESEPSGSEGSGSEGSGSEGGASEGSGSEGSESDDGESKDNESKDNESDDGESEGSESKPSEDGTETADVTATIPAPATSASTALAPDDDRGNNPDGDDESGTEADASSEDDRNVDDSDDEADDDDGDDPIFNTSTTTPSRPDVSVPGIDESEGNLRKGLERFVGLPAEHATDWAASVGLTVRMLNEGDPTTREYNPKQLRLWLNDEDVVVRICNC